MASKVDQAARRWCEAKRVEQVIGGRAARQEVNDAAAALKQAARLTRKR